MLESSPQPAPSKNVHHRAHRSFLWTLLLPLLLLAGCEREAPVGDVILISIDTLRPDHLGCYGYPRPLTPNLDAFRQDAVLFEQAISQAPSTLPAHASMLTGRIPPHHGASFARRSQIAPEAPSIAEALQEGGYATGAFTNGGQMDPAFGLDKGFDRYKVVEKQSLSRVGVEGVRWLDTVSGPAFLFLHTYEVHHPYDPAPRDLRQVRGMAGSTPYRGPLPDAISIDLLRQINAGEVAVEAADVQHIVDTYDAEILSMDRAFGRLVAALQERGRYRDALIIVASDHGEEFGEHGKIGWHSHTLYDELLRIPLLIKLPGNDHAGGKVSQQVRLLDIPRTIQEVAQLKAGPEEEGFDGASLLPWMEAAEVPPLPAMSAIDLPEGEVAYSLRTEDWKLYQLQLFHLPEDPKEQANLIDQQRRQWHDLNGVLGEIVNARPEPGSKEVTISPEMREKLQALGYAD